MYVFLNRTISWVRSNAAAGELFFMMILQLLDNKNVYILHNKNAIS
jgi:hypothetical protein